MTFLTIMGCWLFIVAFVESILKGSFYQVPVIATFTAILARTVYVISFVLCLILAIAGQIGS